MNEKKDQKDEMIKFGTDGYRAVIAEGFTTEKVKIISQGVSEYLEHDVALKGKKAKVIIGYDSRFLSGLFAKRAAQVFSANNIETHLSDAFCTAPVISNTVVNQEADLGIMITASHNPYPYNGYKIKGPFGGSATMDIVQKIEKRVNEGVENGLYYRYILADGPASGKIQKGNFTPSYLDTILKLIDIEAIKGIDFHFLIDPMYGAGQKVLKNKIDELAPGKATEIHSQFNPAFGGINPEPIGSNLDEAVAALRQQGLKLAICLDGDGDRIGALDEDGTFVSSHHIFALVLESLIQDSKTDGKVVKTVSTSSIIERICAQNDIPVLTTPVGFKYIADHIIKDRIMMGGEESGGLWFYPNIPERDGILLGLKILEIVSKSKKSLKNLLKDLYEKYGYFEYARKDYEIEASRKAALITFLNESVPLEIKDKGFQKLLTLDGYKYILEDGSWIMIRPSGTEDVVRVYTESDNSSKIKRLQEVGEKIIYGSW